MALKSYGDKLNNKVYSIGMHKRVPEGGANLAYVNAPKISDGNISIINEFEGYSKSADSSVYGIYYANQSYVLENKDGIAAIPNQNIIVTDEFSIRGVLSENDTPTPLYYVATLSKKIKGAAAGRNVVLNSIPYLYGYDTRNIEQIRNENTNNDKDEIMPLINILEIKDEDGFNVDGGYKIRLKKMPDADTGDDAYQVIIYNSFDKSKTYKVTYRAYDGSTVTEVLNSNLLFAREHDKNFIDEITDDEQTYMVNSYFVEQGNDGYTVYAPSKLYKFTDENRKPWEFKYRTLANLSANYSKSTPVTIKAGMIYLNGGQSDDAKSFISAMVHETSSSLPEYISFRNPHPPTNYWKDPSVLDNPMEYLGAQEYWEINLTAPQHYINDYDMIFITGYGGVHDLSAYNTVLHNYLMQGGKIVIDNLSNEAAGLLRLNFGTTNPIIDYSYTITDGVVSLNNNGRVFVDGGKYKYRHYDMTTASLGRIGYVFPDNTQVKPEVEVVTNNDWVDIIRYSNGEVSIGYKNYFDRGKVFFSNCGLIKAYSQNPSMETKQFVANMIIALAEDKWVSTPWIYDRVYHIDQLFDDEISSSKYIYDIDANTGKTIAKKILEGSVKDAVSDFYGTDIYNFDGTYTTEVLEQDSATILWRPATNVIMPASMNPEDPIYAYAVNSNGKNFSVDDLRGYSKSNVSIYNEKVTFKFTVVPYTYIWRNDAGNVIQEKLYAGGTSVNVIEKTISKAEGLVNLGLLASMIPELPGGPEWSDMNNIFFEVKVGYYENGAFNSSEKRVNMRIYDKATGEYKYNSDGDNVITYNDLYAIRRITRSDGTSINLRKSEDIVVQAITDYYVLTANKRIFAIKELKQDKFEIQMPSGLNTNENWHPRIRNVNFLKRSFNKEDYDRIAKTLGFRLERDYIAKKIRDYYGASPEDDTVAAILAKLDGNEDTLSQQDCQIISEAFDIIDSDMTYEYNIVEYHKQPWNPSEPIKRAKNETAKFIDKHSIKLQYPNLHIVNGLATREKLEKVSPTIYKSGNTNWLNTENVKIEIQDESAIETDGWRLIDSDTYMIDFAKGILTTNDSSAEDIYATYIYSNIDITRKIYINASITKEILTQLDANYYDISHSNILESPVPIVYFQFDNEDPIIATPNQYEIDFERGYLKLKYPTTATRILMSYSYSKAEKLTVKDYDKQRGIIDLNETVNFNDNIYVTYYYENDFYEYMGYRDGDTFVYIDLNPTRGHVCTVPVVNGNAIQYKDIPTAEIVGKSAYVYMLPYRFMKDGSVIKQNDITIRHTFDKNELTLLQLAHPELIVIGHITISNDYTVYDVESLDTRTRGGGLRDSISKETISKVDELSLNFWDISPFDGQKFYANGISIIKLPRAVLDTFTEEEVQTIVENHIAFGVMPIIKYY